MVSQTRRQRIADRIRQELSEMMLFEVSDPRLVGVNITDVEVDRELAFAEIYVSALEGVARSVEALDALHHAQGYFRSELSKRVDLRSFPRLRFHWDSTLERAELIEKLLSTIKTEDLPDSTDKGTPNG